MGRREVLFSHLEKKINNPFTGKNDFCLGLIFMSLLFNDVIEIKISTVVSILK